MLLGVGMSATLPRRTQTVGTVSAKLRRGKHTTRSVRLLETRSGGGMLADTPGFNQPSLEGLSLEQLPDSFPEIRSRLETARRASSYAPALPNIRCATSLLSCTYARNLYCKGLTTLLCHLQS